MYLEANSQLQDIMLKQRRLVVPITVTTNGSDVTSLAVDAGYGSVCEATTDTVTAITDIDAAAAVNATGLYGNFLLHNLGTVTKILCVQLVDKTAGALEVTPSLINITTNGNIELELLFSASLTARGQAIIVDYEVERV